MQAEERTHRDEKLISWPKVTMVNVHNDVPYKGWGKILTACHKRMHRDFVLLLINTFVTCDEFLVDVAGLCACIDHSRMFCYLNSFYT